jgi:hypothetical protein
MNLEHHLHIHGVRAFAAPSTYPFSVLNFSTARLAPFLPARDESNSFPSPRNSYREAKSISFYFEQLAAGISLATY